MKENPAYKPVVCPTPQIKPELCVCGCESSGNESEVSGANYTPVIRRSLVTRLRHISGIILTNIKKN